MKNSLKALMIFGVVFLSALTGCGAEAVRETNVAADAGVMITYDADYYSLEQASLEQAAIDMYLHASPTAGSGTSRDPFSYWYGLHMYVDAGSVTTVGLRLSIINNSERLIFEYGLSFSIEEYAGGRWLEVPFNLAWHMLGFHIDPGYIVEENVGWEIEWDSTRRQLQPGQYRIIRNFGKHPRTTEWHVGAPQAYLYAPFTVEGDWEVAHSIWLAEQDVLAAEAYSRFDGLDLEISDYSPRGLSFTLTNNNPYYGYIIGGVFVGWEDRFPCGGFDAGVVYSIFTRGGGWPNPSWPFEEDTCLQPGESLSLDVDWHYARGYLSPREAFPNSPAPPFPNTFDLVVHVSLDVDEEYKRKHFRRVIPRLPGVSHRITAIFEV